MKLIDLHTRRSPRKKATIALRVGVSIPEEDLEKADAQTRYAAPFEPVTRAPLCRS